MSPQKSHIMKKARSACTRGFLPHWNARFVFVTFRLADSLPLYAMKEIRAYDERWFAKYADQWTEEIELKYQRGRAILGNELLDKALGSCILKQVEVRETLITAMMHFDEVRYRVHAYVIMPNHVHMLVETFDEWRMQDVMHSIKSYSAQAINKKLGHPGKLWARESYDRYIRGEQHFYKVLRYIQNNPRHCAPDEFALYVREVK